jgi:hypothetical protein
MRRLTILLLAALLALPAAAAEKKKKAKKKADPYEGSKYKSFKVLTPTEDHSYRFDAGGNPILPDQKKSAKKKKKSSSEDEEPKRDCAETDTCEAAPSPSSDGSNY